MKDNESDAAANDAAPLNAAPGSRLDNSCPAPSVEMHPGEPGAAPPPETFTDAGIPPEVKKRFVCMTLVRMDGDEWAVHDAVDMSEDMVVMSLGFDAEDFYSLTASQRDIALHYFTNQYAPDAAIKLARAQPVFEPKIV